MSNAEYALALLVLTITALTITGAVLVLRGKAKFLVSAYKSYLDGLTRQAWFGKYAEDS